MGPSRCHPVDQSTPHAEAGEETISVGSVHKAVVFSQLYQKYKSCNELLKQRNAFGCQMADTIVV